MDHKLASKEYINVCVVIYNTNCANSDCNLQYCATIGIDTEKQTFRHYQLLLCTFH